MQILATLTLSLMMSVSQIELYNFIDETANAMDIDPDLVYAVILVENPELDDFYVNINPNKTVDIGIMQLNNKYLWKDFLPKYWHSDIEFNPFNWQHSVYIGISHLQYLYNELKTPRRAIMAYNCGLSCVKKNKVPNSTKEYTKLIWKKYKKLKNRAYATTESGNQPSQS